MLTEKIVLAEHTKIPLQKPLQRTTLLAKKFFGKNAKNRSTRISKKKFISSFSILLADFQISKKTKKPKTQ
ncbi:hypothetical protein CRH03_09060 [Clostridium sp. HMb25]|nr:hypothetical protein CRH03_09060 [Clostridium sp. HMb25]